MRPYATSVWGLELLVYEALSYSCMDLHCLNWKDYAVNLLYWYKSICVSGTRVVELHLHAFRTASPVSHAFKERLSFLPRLIVIWDDHDIVVRHCDPHDEHVRETKFENLYIRYYWKRPRIVRKPVLCWTSCFESSHKMVTWNLGMSYCQMVCALRRIFFLKEPTTSEGAQVAWHVLSVGLWFLVIRQTTHVIQPVSVLRTSRLHVTFQKKQYGRHARSSQRVQVIWQCNLSNSTCSAWTSIFSVLELREVQERTGEQWTKRDVTSTILTFFFKKKNAHSCQPEYVFDNNRGQKRTHTQNEHVCHWLLGKGLILLGYSIDNLMVGLSCNYNWFTPSVHQ